MKITKLTSNDCGGFQKPKGHLDTQMYPECEGTETDRNIVKKTEEKRKKNKNAITNSIYKIIVSKFGEWVGEKEGGNVWNKWKNENYFSSGNIPTEEEAAKFNEFIIFLINYGEADFMPLDPEYDAFRSRLSNIANLLKDGKIDQIRASREFQAVMYEIEQAGDMQEPEDFTKQQLEKQKAWDIAASSLVRVLEAKKKKKWDPNPWAVCHTTVDKDKDPEKYERCVKKVKEKQSFNLSNNIKTSQLIDEEICINKRKYYNALIELTNMLDKFQGVISGKIKPEELSFRFLSDDIKYVMENLNQIMNKNNIPEINGPGDQPNENS